MANLGRWYEKYIYIQKLLEYGETVDQPMQDELAYRLKCLLDEYKPLLSQAEALHENNVTQDLFQHLSLSLKKKRWYDAIPELHTNIDTMLFLPARTLEEMNEHCKGLLLDLKIQNHRYGKVMQS